ncbi:HAD family hydrolase, partial [Streptomyces sp. NPDC001919]
IIVLNPIILGSAKDMYGHQLDGGQLVTATVLMRAHGARVYVGDHVGDVRGAATAGALSVAVATGPCAPAELAEAGADVVLADLTDFRAWWEGYLA